MKTNLLLWIVLLPLFGAVLNGILLLCGKRLSHLTSGIVASLASVGAFALSVQAFFMLQGLSGGLPRLRIDLYTWLQVGSLQIDCSLLMDPLSGLMLLLITGIGSLVHIYSISSMEDDPGAQRYFSYLNLLLFATLFLVLSDSPVTLLLGWQGVGLMSFLLMSFWFEDAEKSRAGVKAFVVNRMGDLGLFVGIFVLFWAIYPHLQTGESLSFVTIEKYMFVLKDTLIFGLSAVEVAGICLFLGVMTKSAQLPLHLWLPDTTVGPTPATAWMHSATVVLAGIYLLVRLNFLYSAAPTSSAIIAGVGAFTAFFAASIALFQNDIKKILAYSTISQLGLIVMGVGVGAYAAGVFHLTTHAFFKSLLFLSAGSVIISLNHEQDIRKMGGLFKSMKITGFTFLIGTLAMIGFPGFSGFFSQNEILWKIFATQHPVVWIMGCLATCFTAFYMTRMFCLVFLGEMRTSPDALINIQGGEPQENNSMITIPLILLSILSAAGGLVGIPYVLTHKNSVIEHWLQPLFSDGLSTHIHAQELLGQMHQHPHLVLGEGALMGLSVLGLLLGAGIAFFLYAGASRARKAIEQETALQQPNSFGWLGMVYRALYHRLYVNEAVNATVVHPVQQLSRDGLWPFDQFVVDSIVNLVGRLTILFSRLLSQAQTGSLKLYLWTLSVGFVTLLLWLLISGAIK